MKQQARDISTLSLSGISFGPLSAQEIKDLSEVDILTSILYEQDSKKPLKHGLLDLRLGTSSKNSSCETCGKSWADCPGHFGSIDLSLPCFHTGYFKNTINILQCICKSCSSFLLPSDKKMEMKMKLLKPNITYVEKKLVKKSIITQCKKVSICPYCQANNGVVKKCSLLKIVHLKYKHDKKTKNAPALEYIQSFENVLDTNKELPAMLQKVQEILNPRKVLELLRNIPRCDIDLCMMDWGVGNPEDMILTRVLVPPSCIRPSVVSQLRSGTTEDDLTVRMIEILEYNESLSEVARNTSFTNKLMEAWDILQIKVALLINGNLSGLPKFSQAKSKPMNGVLQRLKGKQGRFRGNLSGKRVNFSARTVISPDPHLRIDQVGLPLFMAKTLTYPEKVTPMNYEKMRQLIRNGRDVYPGAAAVFKADKNMKFRIMEHNKQRLADELKFGDTVDRNITDGDVVLFNRQPSLHRLSIQAFKVKVTRNRTLQFNECCCNPFNADFDGDEMNIHFPQTEEAKAEALILMDSLSNIISPRNGEPLIAAIQDFITGSYLMTQKDVFFTKQQTAFILSALIDTYIDLPPPAIMKPVQLWTGKQLFSLVMRPDESTEVFVNLRSKCGGKQAHSDSGAYVCPSCKNDLQKRILEKYALISDCKWCPTRLWATEFSKNGLLDSGKVFCDGCRESYAEAEKNARIEPCAGCSYFNKTCRQDELDPSDNFVVIHNSQLLAGYMNKSFLGSGSKNSIFYFILRDFGKERAADALLRLSKLTSKYLTVRGFSIGLKHVAPTQTLLNLKEKLLAEGYESCSQYIQKFENGQLQVAPGCTEEETLEGVLLRNLSQIRDEAGNSCDRYLPKSNAPLTMAIAGSKGSLINVCQMIVCVGQQSVNGKRVPNGFDDRSLYLFSRNNRDPVAKGFVANSFYSGLTDYELSFHAIAGREGLVDTAVKTAETGYMQRRLVKAMEDLKCEYDGSVRNSRQEVIQFVYGSDGLDPSGMEAKYKKSKQSRPTEVEGVRPVDFKRVLWQIKLQHPCREEESLTMNQVQKVYSKLLVLKEYSFLRPYKLSRKGKSDEQPEQARNFGRHMRSFIESLGVAENQMEMDGEITNTECHITRTQLEKFLSICCNKFMSAQQEPGTAVGALAAQSIGEPGTQMTLKTFHFAGVASMNITQGVPRILEIINATKSISTPVAKCPLDRGYDEGFARRVKGRIEKTTLGEVALAFVVTITESDLSITVKLDLRRIELLKLEIDVYTIRRSILSSKLKILDKDIKILSKSEVVVMPEFKEAPMASLRHLQAKLPEVLVCGIPSVKRAVIQSKKTKDSEGKPEEFELIVEGTNLKDIMTTLGVVSNMVESNNITEIKQCLGIEAARAAIINEMSSTMSNHGINVDKRHIMLLADIMTCKGDIMGVNRSGMAKCMESPLMLASFENTDLHLFEAASFGQSDPLLGASEKIIVGAPVNLGTGSFQILHAGMGEGDGLATRTTLFDSF